MVIRLKELTASPESQICFDYTIELSGEEVHFEHPFQKPVRISGRVSDEAGVVRLQALVEAEVHTLCARCAAPVVYDKRVQVDFALVESAGPEDLADDVVVLDSDEVDIDAIAVPELILDMEMAVLCREDCKGLCPKCGKNLNEGPCS